MDVAKVNGGKILPTQGPVKKREPSLIEHQFEKYERENGWKDLFETLDETTDDLFGDLARDCGKEQANRDLNRYRSILPYDHNRVRLSTKDNDYINASSVVCTLKPDQESASFSKGLQKRYIVTQGPLTNTTADFWLMVIQAKVRIVTMLCNVEEDGKSKCWQYFPSVTPRSSKTSSTFTEMVRLFPDAKGSPPPTDSDEYFCGTGLKDMSYLNFKENGLRVSFKTFSPPPVNLKNVAKNDFVIRELEITGAGATGSDDSDKLPRIIYHCHFLTWPDFGVPNSADFLRYWRMIRSIEVEHSDVVGITDIPWVVHCSAGVGRSGTLVIIDACLRILEMDGDLAAINVQNLLIETRKYRRGMIQTADQLRFVYVVVLEAYRDLLKKAQPILTPPQPKPVTVSPVSGSPESSAPTPKSSLPSVVKNQVDKVSRDKNSPGPVPKGDLLNSKSKNGESDLGDSSFLKKVKAIDDLIVSYDKKGEWALIHKKLEVAIKGDKKAETKEALEGDKVTNKVKNRESESIPENEDRIKLSHKKDDDYINANKLLIKPLRRIYILAQSPLENTWEDFLMMAWDQECSVIVMLCQTQESEKSTCFQYWPPDPPTDPDILPLGISTSFTDPSTAGSKKKTGEGGQGSQATTTPQPSSQPKPLPSLEFNTKLFKIVNKGLRYKSDAYDVRSLEIVDTKNQVSQPILHLQYKGWPVYNDPQVAGAVQPVWDLGEDFLDFYLAYWESGIFASRKGNVIIHGNAVADRPSIFALLDSYLSTTQKSKDPSKFPKLALLTQAMESRARTLEDPKSLRFAFQAFAKLCRSLASFWFPKSSDKTAPGTGSQQLVTCLSTGTLQSKFKTLTKESLARRAAGGVLKGILMQPKIYVDGEEGGEEEALAVKDSGGEKSKEVGDDSKEKEAAERVEEVKPGVKSSESKEEKNPGRRTISVVPVPGQISKDLMYDSKSSVSSTPSSFKWSPGSLVEGISSSESSPSWMSPVSSRTSEYSRSSSSSAGIASSSRDSLDLSAAASSSGSGISEGRRPSASRRLPSDSKTPPKPPRNLSRSAQWPQKSKGITWEDGSINTSNVSTQTGTSLTRLDNSYVAYLDMKVDDEWAQTLGKP